MAGFRRNQWPNSAGIRTDARIREGRDGIRQVLERLSEVDGLDALRGHEGTAAARYWAALPAVNRSALVFAGRSRRPPSDAMNAALSFAYVLLAEEVRHWLESLGADPHVGFYHETDGRRPALALDVMEPLRHRVADRLVLRLANLGQLTPEDFHGEPGVQVLFTPEGRQRFLRLWERGMSQAPGRAPQGATAPRALVREACEMFIRCVRGLTDPVPAGQVTDVRWWPLFEGIADGEPGSSMPQDTPDSAPDGGGEGGGS